ncbi:hypothetical protein [Brevibacillus porteri]|uniref:Uncharacterized protein n=1 Tax=Brevibacillus porteri TaxID=2126350 RepID=A0ABX5FVB4_9BACL|nr:hypothetical protein [Brevibacillus porteri]MED1801820.1 hypothetical protein [Brevibacillus porteri]MED2134951.1 hypothetical protein [Brevibacillus porteri]MED2745473.1 hypothetical protein [Brevibacillus porteri]MED2815781.1 hypothetical protein [Brevibacillus porteri]MED2897619.1 hypothetical protein [Brevibacillus porteri]
MSNLPVIQNPTINLPMLNNPSEVFEILEENMAGATPEFPRVKVPSGGGIAFEVPGDDPENPDSVKELEGVVLDHFPVNAFWKQKFSGENNPPDCSSVDGKIGKAPEGAPVKWAGGMQDCKTCPFNQWGTGVDQQGNPTNGKACKNMHQLFILRENEVFPVQLTLPPTSMPNWTAYTARLSGKLKRFYGVVTKVKLKKAKSSGGIDYSEAIFGSSKELSPEEIPAMKALSDQLKGAMRKVAIDNMTEGSEPSEPQAAEEIM